MSEVTRVTDLTGNFTIFQTSSPSYETGEAVTLPGTRDVFDRIGCCFQRSSDYPSCEDESVCVNMDRDKIVQVLINLIRNAFEAMSDPGEVHIDMIQEGDNVLISIADTGSGIPERSLTAIFNPFYNKGGGNWIGACALSKNCSGS